MPLKLLLGMNKVMKNPVLSIADVTKRINNKEIIKGISFNIEKGEVFGFLGPNGAGKSSTLRMIVGLSKPTSGNITICGHSVTKDYVKAMQNVGCIIETPDLYGYLSGFDNLSMLASMSTDVSPSDIMDAVELVGMENRIYDKVRTYSMGMKQRLGLAQALIHRPKLLVLDEPMNGLDPQGIFTFRGIIKQLAKENNTSVLLSSHLITEVQLMCTKVSIINDGLVIKSEDVESLLSSSEVYWIIDDPIKGKLFLKRNFNIDSSIVGTQLEATIDLMLLESINTSFIAEGFKLKYVSSKNITLEELFLNLTKNQKIT
jgi:ABC-2 type transport system ATP-binding protein